MTTLVILPDGTLMFVAETIEQAEGLHRVMAQGRERFPDLPPILVISGPVEIDDRRVAK